MKCALRLTEAHIKLVHREVADPGPDPRRTHFSDADYEEHLGEFLKERPNGPIQVFCYGSLIWRPAFEPAATARAVAKEWHRSFCLHMARWRGSPEVPGLMMQIDRGGECEGIIQQVPEANELVILHALWRREMTIKPPGNYPRWIEIASNGRAGQAIAFTANPESLSYTGGLPIDVVAERISRACGHWGSNAEYLRQTTLSLESEGIHDPYLWDLQERVAKKIEQRFPQACLT